MLAPAGIQTARAGLNTYCAADYGLGVKRSMRKLPVESTW